MTGAVDTDSDSWHLLLLTLSLLSSQMTLGVPPGDGQGRNSRHARAFGPLWRD
jgi:hypothetical protein